MKKEILSEIRKEYAKLCKNEKLSKSKKIELAFSKLNNNQSINLIMVCIGTYMAKVIQCDNKLVVVEMLLNNNDERATYKKYKNIETGLEVDIDIEIVDFYEESINIINLPSCKTKKEYLKMFKILQDNYFELLLCYSETKALNNILNNEYVMNLLLEDSEEKICIREKK